MVQQAAKGDPAALYGQMMQNDPRFRQFVEENRGKTPEQIASEHGIDLGSLIRMMR